MDHAFPPDEGDTSASGTVRIEFDRRADGLAVRVVDDGVGVPEGFTVAEATGLGLTIVRTFVEGELGGRIRLDRVESGSGTVAEVWVPGSRLVDPGGNARDPAT